MLFPFLYNGVQTPNHPLLLVAFLHAGCPYNWRAVIADNASTDRTLEVAKALSERIPEVVFIHLDEKGRGRALRRGIELSHRSGNVEVQTGGYRMLARLKQAQGDASAALAALQEAHQLARDHDVTPFVHARNAACHAQSAAPHPPPTGSDRGEGSGAVCVSSLDIV